MNYNRPRPDRPRRSPALFNSINPDAAGIDCGAAEHYVAVPADRSPSPIQSFKTFTSDLIRLADWLVACGVTSVAMEATGVYWIPIYDLLEARGLEVLLVNARHIKHVPGRKSDVSDCEWLRDLHSVGLLRGSFRPTEGYRRPPHLSSPSPQLVESAGRYIQRMQKALVQMNVQLPLVVSDITGVTGLENSPRHRRRPARPRAARPPSGLSVSGHARGDRRRVNRGLSPGPVSSSCSRISALLDACQRRLADCDRAIEAQLAHLTAAQAGPPRRCPRLGSIGGPSIMTPCSTSARPCIGSPAASISPRLTGSDLHGVEINRGNGSDMTRWPNEQHFTSWLTLAPKNKISGGRLLSARTEPSANRAAAMLAHGRDDARPRIDRARRVLPATGPARIGKPQAITATARKLAILVYRALKGELVYRDPGADAYDRQQRSRVLRRLRRTATTLGFNLVNRDTGEILHAASL